MHAFTGEATVAEGPRAKLIHAFDLRFELEWRAQLREPAATALEPPATTSDAIAAGTTADADADANRGVHMYAGRLRVAELASHCEPEEYEMSIDFEVAPAENSSAQSTLIGIIGPLRREAASRAEGRLTHQVWKHLGEFRSAFEALGVDLGIDARHSAPGSCEALEALGVDTEGTADR